MLSGYIRSAELVIALIVVASPLGEQDKPLAPLAAPLCLQKFESPTYPRGARGGRIEGAVNVKFHTDPDGYVWSSDVKSEIPLFTDIVKDAVSKWQVCTRPNVNDWGVRFEFKLEGSPTNEWAPTVVKFAPPATWSIITRPACLAGCPPAP